MLNRVLIVASFILFFFCYGAYTDSKFCPHSFCNFAGICFKDPQHHLKCKCLPQYYTGSNCNNLISHCISSPCRNGASCVNIPGHYVCICLKGFSGMQCELAGGYTVGLQLILHYVMDFGVSKKFVLVCNSLGTIPMGITITAQRYLIKILRWNDKTIADGSQTSTWHHSNNIIQVLYRMGIRDVSQLPFVAGYYLVMDVSFWEEGEQEILVNLRKLPDGSHINTLKYKIFVHQPKDCAPNFELNSCAYPESPMIFSFYRFANLYPRIRKRCNGNLITGHWQVFNAEGSIFLHDFGKKSSLLLKMPQYTMWFNKIYPGLIRKDNFYMLKLIAYDGKTIVVFRCYVLFVSARVQAIISGGLEQQYPSDTSITIDGSRSRDFNNHPQRKQTLSYEWKCASKSDPKNNFCKTFAATYNSKMSANFASSELILHNKYTITLTVRSLIDPSRYDSTEQSVSVEGPGWMNVGIQCIRNCDVRSYIPDQFVHLKAICKECSNSSEYNWEQNSEMVGIDERLIIDLSGKTEKITLTVISDNSIGKASITLTRNKAPINQKCSFLKNTGIECFTALQSHCKGGSKDVGPYYYIYDVANVTFKVRSHTLALYLPHDEQLKVTICDRNKNCDRQQLHLNLKPFKVPTTLAGMKRFFENRNTSIRLMLANNNVDPALCIAHRFAKNAKTLAEANLIYDQYKDFQFPRLIDTDRIFLITAALIKSLQPIDYQKAEFFGKQIGLIFRSLDIITKDKEIRDMLYPTYVFLSKMLVRLYDVFCIQTEEMARELLFYDNEDAFVDHTIKWPDFDATVTIRMSAWLKLFEVMNRCTQAVGKISTQFHYPKEPPLIVTTTNAELKVEVIEDLDEDRHYTADFSNNVRLPVNSIELARQALQNNDILIQSIQFMVNPAWWYPSHWVPTSNSFSYNLYSNYKHLEADNIPIFINSNKTQSDREPMFVDDTLISNTKISIFRTSVPPYGVLLVHFTMTTAELYVLLQLHTTPTLYQVWNEPTCIVTSQRTLVLTSHCPQSNVAYMAVLAPQKFDADHKPNYQFYMMIRQCAHWDFKNHGWENSKCTALFRPENPSKLVCGCKHLSTFAAREVPVHPTALRKMGSIKDNLDINWACVIFYAAFFTSLLVLLWMTWSNIGRHNVIHVISREEASEIDYKTEKTLIHLRTGGRVNAFTTASVILDFVSERTGYCRIVIYQDPKNPQLIDNSNCMTRISSNKLQLPAQLTIRHDGNGDYPNWYCREILVDDFKNNLTCIYTVRMWISKNMRYSVAPSPFTTSQWESIKAGSSVQKRRLFITYYQWRYLYYKSIAHSYINWFFMQPILGPFRYDDRSMNGFQRTCIWMSKLVVSVCVVCAYYGRTTIYNYYDYFETSSAINILNVLMISLICFFTGLVVEYTFNTMVNL